METKSFNLYRYSIPVDSQLILRGRFLKRREGLIVRMIALGADATMIGRSFVYALGADGQRGVENMLDIFYKEMRVAMTLTSNKNITDITRDALVDFSK